MRTDLGRGIEPVVVDALEDLQRLEQHRALPPGSDLRNRVAAEIDGHRCLEMCVESGEVGGCHHSGVVTSGRVPVRGGDELLDRLGDEAGLPFLDVPQQLWQRVLPHRHLQR